jgi:cytochrome c oxidase subunit III
LRKFGADNATRASKRFEQPFDPLLDFVVKRARRGRQDHLSIVKLIAMHIAGGFRQTEEFGPTYKRVGKAAHQLDPILARGQVAPGQSNICRDPTWWVYLESMAPVTETEESSASRVAPPLPADTSGGGPPPIGPLNRGWGGDGDEGRDPRYIPGAGLLAMRFVLVSVTALFITVGIAYYERAQSAIGWEHIHVPRMLWVSTALILASGWMLEAARSAFERRDAARYVQWLEITVFGGLAFLACQVLALRELVGQGIYLQHNPHSSLFYVLTGVHGLHLLGGIAALLYLAWGAMRLQARSKFQVERQRTRTQITAIYWHFLTVLWLALFLGLLLWP